MERHETDHHQRTPRFIPKESKLKSFYLLCVLMVIAFTVLRLSSDQEESVHVVPLRFPKPEARFWTAILPELNTTTTSLPLTTNDADHRTTTRIQNSTTDLMTHHSLSFKSTTSHSTSFYSILNYKKNYSLCDEIEITIQLRTSQNQTKFHGGDFIWVWVYDYAQRASSVADHIIDNNNGTFTAKVTPRWTGKTMVGVSLVHSSEIVSNLRHFREMYPARYSYKGIFTGPTRAKTVQPSCHVSKQMYVPVSQRYQNMVYCDYSDPKSGFPWFCVKPQGVGCEKYIRHSSGGSANEFHKTFTSADFVKHYRRSVPIPPINPSQTTFMVTPAPDDINVTSSACLGNDRPLCTSGLPPQNSTPGFYYQDNWTSLICKNRHFTTPDVIKCLKNQTLHFIGDSTLRQWYEYLVRNVLKANMQERKGPHDKFGPHSAIDEAHNISMYFNFHGYPLALGNVDVKQIHYVAEQLDSYTDLDNTIVCLCLWAHFTGTNLQYYKDRLQSVKDAIQRLKQRNPNVRVYIKSANTREHSTDFDRSNWYSWEIDKVMKEFFSGFPGITVIDVWDMTIGHRTGYNLHPGVQIISQEMDMFLSLLCPVETN